MAERQTGTVLGHLRRLLGTHTADEQTDGQLLERFLVRRDETAFTALVRRHGPLVLGLCRRLLGNTHDAEDAFQATFLVLVRRAGSLDRRGSVAGWLYGVAYRVAVRTRAQAARRRAHERQARPMQPTATVPDPDMYEVRQILDEELSRLPEKYRSPIVLCYLEGKTHAEAARQLDWPLGTVRGRVARARDLLRGRLVRRGVTLPAGLFAAILAPSAVSAAVPTALAESTVEAALLVVAGKAATGALSVQAATLGDAVLKEMFLAKLKVVMMVLLAVGVATTGVGALAYQWGGKSRDTAAESVGQGKGITDPSLAPQEIGRFRHEGGVHALAFSPDGKTLASAGGDDAVRLWEISTGAELHRLTKHHHGVFGLSFTGDGRTLALGSGDHTVRLWDLATGQESRMLAGHHHGVRALALSPDDRVLAAAGTGDMIHLWDLPAHKKLHPLPGHAHGVSCLSFSGDGTRLASAGGDQQVRLWDVAEAKEVRAFQGHHGRVASVVCFPNGKLLASGGEDKTIRLWEAATGHEVRRWHGHEGGVSCLTLSGDGQTLVSGGGDGAVRLWQGATGEQLRQLTGPGHSVSALALSRDGKTLASAARDGTIVLWRLAPER